MTSVATLDDLALALPHVLASPKTGAAEILCTRPARNQRDFRDRLQFSRDKGVADDFGMSQPWLRTPDGRPDPRIQVSVLNARVLEAVWRDRAAQIYPGDTIIADLDLTETSLPAGSLVRAGSAVLKVSGLWNNGCAKWKVRYGSDAHAWVSAPLHARYRLRGILCSIEEDGEVAIGDMLARI